MSPTLAGRQPVDLRRAFRPAASSVWVVTSAHDGVPVGFTAISVASVSVTPALLSFNISRTSSSLATLRASRRYAVHLLAGTGEHTARRFAATAAERFADPTTWSWDADGVPALRDVAARVSGEVVSFVEAGDSLVAICSATSSDVADSQPLLHHDRSYLALGRDPLARAER